MSTDFAVRNNSSMDYFLQMQKQNDEIAFQQAEARQEYLSAETEANIESQSMFEKLLKDKMVPQAEMPIAEENKQSLLSKTIENEKTVVSDWKVNTEGIQRVEDSDKNNGELAELDKTEEKENSLAQTADQVPEAESVSKRGENLKPEFAPGLDKTEEKNITLAQTTDQVPEAEPASKSGENLKPEFALGLDKTKEKKISLAQAADQVPKAVSNNTENLEAELAEEKGKLLSFFKSEGEAVSSDKKSNKSKNVADPSLEKFNSVFGKDEDFPVDFGVPVNEKGKTRKQSNKREIVKVIDLRKDSADNAAGATSEQATETKTAASENSANIANKNFQFVDGGEGIRTFQFNPASSTSGETTLSKQGNAVFQNMLFDNLKENGNADIVKNARFILKDSGTGEIRLIMKPESLGYVRIMLTLEDNNIAGKIIVDNKSVKEVFENNMENLVRSFKENGFAEASLDVSVGIGVGNKDNDKSNPFNEDRKILAKKEIEKVDSQRTIRYGMEEEMLVDMVI